MQNLIEQSVKCKNIVDRTVHAMTSNVHVHYFSESVPLMQVKKSNLHDLYLNNRTKKMSRNQSKNNLEKLTEIALTKS